MGRWDPFSLPPDAAASGVLPALLLRLRLPFFLAMVFVGAGVVLVLWLRRCGEGCVQRAWW